MPKDQPWLFRTYAGHSSAAASNALYRGNLAKGQTGLSVAFDLPTQTGYDSDHPLARGEVGKVGVPIAHLGDMHIKTIQLAWPPDDLRKKTKAVFEPMCNQVIALKQKITNLRRTRDLLLPSLLSGQIEVGVAGEAVPA